MSAIRYELSSGELTNGKSHTQKGREYLTALDKWLANNPTASAEDIAAAKAIRADLADALEGR